MKRFWVLLVSALIIGGLGYFGWQYGQNRDKTNTNSQNQVTNDPSEGGKYLVITEWNVRFLIPEEQKGEVIYVRSTNYDENSALLIKMNQVDMTKSSCGSESNGVFAIYRMDIQLGEQTTPPKFRTIDNHNYYLSECEDYGLDSGTEFEIDSLIKSVKDTLETYSSN